MATDKTHKIPNAPNLRFPEFDREWGLYTLGDICSEFQSGKYIKADNIMSEGSIPVYGGNGLRGYTDSWNHQGGYVLIGRQGALCGNVRYVSGNTYITEHAIAVKASENNNTKFLQYLFECMDLGQYSDQSAQPGLAVNKLLKLKARIPHLKEQIKIANFFASLDTRITTQIGAIEATESLITGITSKVSRSNNVKQMYLKDLLTERTERNADHYEVYSVSVSEGVVNQVDYLGRSFAAADTSHYCVARYGDIIYTKSPTGSFPYGIVKRSDISEPVAVSPLYGVYRPLNDNIGIYLHQYFCSAINAHNYLHKLIQKGAKNTINITNQRFLQNTIPIPDEVTLEKYVRVIDALVQKLKNEKFLLESYRQQKFYLLKNMFV